MNSSYSQFRAMMAIARASFRSITRSPSAVVFSLAFPLIFIIVFGFIGGGRIVVDVAVDKNCDINNSIYKALEQINMVNLIKDKPEADIKADLEKGRIDAKINIRKDIATGKPSLAVDLTTTDASREKGNFFKMILNQVVDKQVIAMAKIYEPFATINQTEIKGREYKTIDFILPGQLGFSILSAGVFGTAFVFISLRQTLVIKRFFATPIKKQYIVLGEALSRLVFSLIGSLIIIGIGHFLFGFTLVHGFITVINMLILSAIGLIIFMGFGFFVSGIAKNESAVPPIANIFTMPQFLLAGTFFSIDAFPSWLQPVSRALPLTYLNDAMRKVAFEGAGLFDLGHQLMILGIWGIIIYALAIRVFKWE